MSIMKRIAIFLSAASLAVTGIISCEKEPDTETPVPVESVSLDKDALAIVLGIDETKTLTATVYPETATDKTVKWESADPETASVDENGVVKGLSAGETVIVAITADGGKTARCDVSVLEALSGHGYVDLGLSVRWAACNVGADSPEEYGDYFAWGEITPKDEYTKENAIEIDNDILSITGSKEYDAARAIWGAPWQLPTKVQVEELLEKGEWEWTGMNGCRGCKVTGPNGNSIFLPAAGWIQGSSLLEEDLCGSYWAGERWSHMLDYGEHLYFNGNANYFDNIGMPRFDGASVRPVVGLAE